MFAMTRLMIITQNNDFAIRLKQAFEAGGQFNVVTFTTIQNAVTYLQTHPQDVILLDMTVPGLSPGRDIEAIRNLQPDTAIVVMPDIPSVRQHVTRLQLDGLVDTSYRIRQVLDVLENARQQRYEAQPDTAQAPAIVEDDTVIIQDVDMNAIVDAERPVAAPIVGMDLILSDDDNGQTTIFFNEDVRTESSQYRAADVATEIFNKLAADEPPMPSFEEGGTISDLMGSMADSNNLQRLARQFQTAGEDTPAFPDAPEEDSRAIPAVMILEDAMDDSTPLNNFSVEQFLSRVQTKMQGEGLEILPLPSWIAESEEYVRPPDFLPDDLADLYSSQPLEYTSPGTIPADFDLLDIDAGNLSTDVNIPIEANSAPTILTDPSEIQVEEPEDEGYEDYPVIESANPEANIPDATESPETIPDIEDDLSSDKEALSPETSYAAQMALALTQVSLESTAESTVLIKEGEIAAFAGALPLEDIEAIREAVEGDWAAAPAQGRIRFLTMPITGVEYMLYSRGLEGGFTLSLIFSGTKPLHAIRRQGKRMSEALSAVPQPATIPDISIADTTSGESGDMGSEADEIPDVGPLTPVTLVLALRDPDDTMAETLRRLMAEGIQAELAQLGWQLQTLDVEEDLIYLFVDAPESETSYEHIQTLKSTATALMQQQFPGVNEEVWADAYMVLRPGREMTTDERQDFMHFLRM